MAKKVRFALEMDNGVEVRSMEELRESFSLVRVLDYLKNGKLVIWLRDHYENDKANAIEQLDKLDAELAKKVCEIFDVSYNENIEADLERAAARAERIKKLKEYTTEKKYLDVIDNVAFDQDEMYDLLDEDVYEIYLCGDRFSIPLSKSGVTYIGINNPVVVIDSKVEVDWEAIGITIEDVVFDKKYQAVLDSANETKAKLYDKVVENVKAQSATMNMEGSTKRDIVKFLSFILEKVEELHDRDWDYEYDEVCEEFELEELDPDDYGNNEYDYSSQSKAKHACKEQLGVMINDVKEQYQEIRSERYEEIVENYEAVNSNISEVLEDISVEVEDFLDDCEDDTAIQKIRKLFNGLNLNEKADQYNIVNQVSALVTKILPEKTTAIKKISEYMEKCDYDEDEDMYSYNLEYAADEMVENVNDVANDAISKLYDGFEIVYKDIRDSLGVLILKSAYNQLVLGIEKTEMPELLCIDDLTEKLIKNNDIPQAIGNVLNKHMTGLFGVMQGVEVADKNLSPNGVILVDTMNQVNEYIKKNAAE